jgi:endonuclease-3
MARAKRIKRLPDSDVAALFDTFAVTIDPVSELNWQTPRDLTIAVVLSAQATDVSVNKVTTQLWQHCRTPDDYLALGEEGVAEAIKTIGLFRNKAKAVIGLCTRIRDEFGGDVPSTREELQSLPGVGRKTANVILNVVFGQPTLAVDTHIFRVSNRMGLCAAKTPDATEKALLARIPKQHLLHAHHYLILHGRYTCKARKPDCAGCGVREWCNYPEKTTV